MLTFGKELLNNITMEADYPIKNYFRPNFFKKRSFHIKWLLSFFVFLSFAIDLNAQTTFTSVQSGNYNDPATWGTATAPTSIDNIVIASATVVMLNDVFTANNVTINGTIESSSSSSEFVVTQNLTVNAGGLFNGVYYFDIGGWGYFKSMQLSVAGNIINNGRIDLSQGSNYDPEGVLNLNGSSVQTVSGTGTFGGTDYTTDNTNTGAVINQLIINNTNASTPNVVWGFTNIKIRSLIKLTNARIELGVNKLTIGNYGSAITICENGNGFLNGTIARWYGGSDIFSPIIPGTDYYNNITVFPFISSNGKNRSAFISRPMDNTFSGVSGELLITYNDADIVSSGFSATDGAYVVTDIYEGAWTVAKDATYSFPIGNQTLAFAAEDAFLIKNGNSRILTLEGVFPGTHQTGTNTPFASRTGLSDSDFATTYLIGYNAALDTPVTSVQSGSWSDAATWSNNAIPSCNDTMTILSGHTVTINSTGSAAGVNIDAGGTLISNSSNLTIGCTNNNSSFFNKGTYTMNGGSLVVNGNVVHASGSSFNQIGGDIIVDGNNNGQSATSSSQTLFKIATSTLNLTGGKITIVDPAVSNTNVATSHAITSIVPCTGFFCFFPTNIFLDSTDGIAIGQIIEGTGIPIGTSVVSINFDGSINTSPSLPSVGLSLPLNVTFYNVVSSPSSFVYESNVNYAVGANHTLQIGDGISLQKSTVTTNGFNCNFRAANGVLSLNNLIVDALDSSNRFVNLDNINLNSNIVILNVQNDFTIAHGKVKGSGVDTYYGGNVVNNGELNLNNNTNFGNYIDGNSVSTSKPQIISGTGAFNAQTDGSSYLGSVSQLSVNNTSVEGVTFLVPFSVVNSLTMTEGIIHTSSTSVLNVGNPSLSPTAFINGNFGPTCYIDGPVSKVIGAGQNAIDLTNGSMFLEKFFFPVGKSSYTPIWVGVTTPGGGFDSPGANIKVEAFETNLGSPSSNIAFLSQNRWEVSKTAGTIIDFNIRVADPNAIESSIVVQSNAATGVYDNDFGITSTFVSGTPNTLTPVSNPLPFSSFKGYFSTARQSECVAVNPGNTLTSETAFCAGKPVSLSVENIIVGEGITYQWQSSTNGTTYSDLSGAIDATYQAIPIENTYYRCNVTCSYSSTTVASTPIQILLNNTITSSVPATICLPINVATLSAISSSGDVKWYDSQIGGSTLSTGNSFTTPELTETTTFYAGTENTTNGTAGLVYTLDGYSTGGTNKGLAFNLANSIILNSVKVYPQQNPGGAGPSPMTIKVLQNGVQVPNTLAITFTPNTASDWAPSTVPQTIFLFYQLAAGNNYSLEITDGSSYDNALAYVSPFPSPFPVSNGAVTILGGIDNGSIDTFSYNYFFDWDVTEVCSSARVAVVATVLSAEDCNLGTATSELLANITAYPNPYEQTFRLNIQSNNTSNIDVKVVDMIGRVIDSFIDVPFNKIFNLEIGAKYPSGVYNVLVMQDGKTKTLQVIKE